MKILWGFIKFCLMLLGYSIIAVFTVMNVVTLFIALCVIFDDVPESVWQRKDG